MEEKQQPPVLRIGAGDFTALVRAGEGLVCLHNEVVGRIVPVRPVWFERGATDEQIVKAWQEAQG